MKLIRWRPVNNRPAAKKEGEKTMEKYKIAINRFFEIVSNNNLNNCNFMSGAFVMLCRMIEADNDIKAEQVDEIIGYFNSFEKH